MNTDIIKIDRDNIDGKLMKKAAACLSAGGLVCFPTETVYGLGGNAFDGSVVSKIYAAKGRPADNPLIVHISDYEMLKECTVCDEQLMKKVTALGEAFWPGPMTVILPKSEKIPKEVSCGLSTVGIRFPSNPVARKLIELAGVPVAAPSANISGKPSPTRAIHVEEDLDGKVDMIIDGGNCDVGVESTVIDLTGDKPTILRPGAVTLEDLRRIFPDAEEYNWKSSHAGGEGFSVEKPKSPGMKYKHYAPDALVFIVDGDFENVSEYIKNKISENAKKHIKTAVMTTESHYEEYADIQAKNGKIVFSMGGTDAKYDQSSKLFDMLRNFDKLGFDEVYAEALPCSGVDDAVMNRLYRAAAGRIIKV